MTIEALRQMLEQLHCTYDERAIQNGTQFRCHTGEIFSWYTTGKISVGGIKTELSERMAKAAPAMRAVSIPAPSSKTHVPPTDVFVVYGRDVPARDELELVIRRMGLNPIILSALPAAGDTLIEKLESYLGEKGRVAYACVLVTPDDEGYLAGAESEKKYRARQNVVMELGMVLAGLGRKRVAILIKSTVEHPSDIAGLIYIPFQEHVFEIQNSLYSEFVNAGQSPKLP